MICRTVQLSIIIILVTIIRATATVHPALVQHFLLTNNLKIVQFLSCNPRTLLPASRIAQLSHVYSGSASIRTSAEASQLDDRHFRHDNHRVAIVLDLQCPVASVRALFAAISRRTYFHRRYFWLLFGADVAQIEELLGAENVNVDAEITVATRADSEVEVAGSGEWQLWDVYNPSFERGGRLQVTPMQRWRDGEAIGLPAGWRSKYDRRRDFGGLTLKGVLVLSDITVNHSLQADLETTELAYLNSMNRLNYHLFQMIQDMHNFRIYLIRAAIWGYTVNGTWIGAIGFLDRHEVDICMAPVRLSPERFGYFEYTTYTFHARVMFLFRHPKTNLQASNVFLQPFVTAVWLVIGAVGLGIAVLVRQLLVLENRQNRSQDPAHETSGSNALIMIFGILFQQGYEVEPRWLSARIVTLSALFLSLMLLQFYSSFIVGSLLMETPKTIRTIQQLQDSRLVCGIDEISYIRDILNHAIDPAAIRLYRTKIMAQNRVYHVDRGLELIKRGGFAFFMDISSAYLKLKKLLSDEEICELQDITFTKPVAAGPAVPMQSPLVELLKIDLRRLYEAGLHAYHSAIWEQRKPKCTQSSVEVSPIDLEHFKSALYLLALGAVLSAAICGGECIFKAITRRRERIAREQAEKHEQLPAGTFEYMN